MPDLTLDTGDLWRWVDRLTIGRRERVVRHAFGSKARVEYFDVPALWVQLQRDIVSTSGGGGRGAASSGSRSPLNLAKVALAHEIADLVVDGLVAHGLTPRVQTEQLTAVPTARPAPPLLDHTGQPTRDPDLAGRLAERAARTAGAARARRDTARAQYDTRSDLRQLATAIVGTADADLITWWADRYRSWVTHIETALGADDESVDIRGARGVACPACATEWVTSQQPSSTTATGWETFRDPALVIQFRDGQVQHVTCRACLTGWWRGDGLDELTQRIARPLHTSTSTDTDSQESSRHA